MFVNDSKTISEANQKIEKANQKFVDKFINRHVKEKNEPLLDKFINDFYTDYGKIVVAPSMKEIIKFVKNPK